MSLGAQGRDRTTQLGVIPVIAQYAGVLVSVLLATAFHLQLRIRQCK
ncbi:hypothetical protein CDBH8_0546 [Corynebacterium diphtheriae BH8]|nr:hypothetical protein CDBH8_0546 [Corynebacterium diphtheriae BH8]